MKNIKDKLKKYFKKTMIVCKKVLIFLTNVIIIVEFFKWIFSIFKVLAGK